MVGKDEKGSGIQMIWVIIVSGLFALLLWFIEWDMARMGYFYDAEYDMWFK
jgi:hypothetical protein